MSKLRVNAFSVSADGFGAGPDQSRDQPLGRGGEQLHQWFLPTRAFQRNVLEGHLFLFVNKRRDRLKALWWDRDGLVIWYKRLERGCFELPRNAAERPHITLDATALAMLLGGVPLGTRRRVRYSRAG